MKKLLFSICTACLIIPSALAYSSTDKTAPDLIPAETDMVMEFDLGEPNILDNAVINMVKGKFKNYTDESLPALMDQILTDNYLTIAYNSIYDAKYVLFECKASDFNALTQTSYTKENYNNYTIASSLLDESYTSFINNYCVFTNTEQSIKNMIDVAASGNYSGINLYEPYKKFDEKRTPESFLSIFINPSIAYLDMYSTSELISAIIGEGFSFSETPDGLKMNIYMQGDTNTIETLDYAFDKYNFVPRLYTKISGQKLIAYIGANNLSGSLTDTLDILSGSAEGSSFLEEAYAQLNEMLGINVQTDLLPVLNGEWLFTMHDSGTEMPSFTVVFNVSSDIYKAQAAASALNQKIKETFEKIETEEQSEFYSTSTKTVLDTTFTVHQFISTENPEADPFYLNIGVSSDGIFTISTHPNISLIYKTDSGLTTNSGFRTYFTNTSESIKEIIYFDFDNLKSYVIQNMTKSGATSSDIAAFEDMFGSWHNLYAKIYANKTQEWGDMLIKVDLDKITGIDDMLNGYLSSYLASPVKFCDVKENDWFYDFVTELANSSVVQGYGDGCFKPGNDITRGEFIKMAFAKSGYMMFPEAYTDQVFSDINGTEWYSDYINAAYYYGFVKGYDDGTFKPNDPITRAEALQIISNFNYSYSFMLDMYSGIDSRYFDPDGAEPFIDVNENDWFYDPVRYAYLFGTISASDDSKFNPYRHLTRAEAAKMLYLGL